jgi:hypothetical protein
MTKIITCSIRQAEATKIYATKEERDQLLLEYYI